MLFLNLVSFDLIIIIIIIIMIIIIIIIIIIIGPKTGKIASVLN